MAVPVAQVAPNVTVPVPQIAAGVTVGAFGIGLTVTPVVAVTEHLLPLIAVKVTVTVYVVEVVTFVFVAVTGVLPDSQPSVVLQLT